MSTFYFYLWHQLKSFLWPAGCAHGLHFQIVHQPLSTYFKNLTAEQQ